MNNLRAEASPAALGGPSAAELTACADRLLEVVPRTMHGIRLAMRSTIAPALTVTQLRALLFVANHSGCGLSPLAEHLGMSLPSASALVARLVRAGLLDRSGDPGERRRIQLGLTDAGSAGVASARRSARSWLRQRLAALSAEELRGLQRSLDLLARISTAESAAR